MADKKVENPDDGFAEVLIQDFNDFDDLQARLYFQFVRCSSTSSLKS